MNNIPKYILWALMAITIVITLIFFVGGEEKVLCNGIEFDAPTSTSTFISLAFAFIIIAVIATVALAGLSFINKVVSNPKAVLVPIIAFGVLAVLLLATYFGADTTPINIIGYEGGHDAWIYRLTNMCMCSAFVLAIVACLATVTSSLFKKF